MKSKKMIVIAIAIVAIFSTSCELENQLTSKKADNIDSSNLESIEQSISKATGRNLGSYMNTGSMAPGDYLQSKNGKHRFYFLTNGILAITHNGRVAWTGNTPNKAFPVAGYNSRKSNSLHIEKIGLFIYGECIILDSNSHGSGQTISLSNPWPWSRYVDYESPSYLQRENDARYYNGIKLWNDELSHHLGPFESGRYSKMHRVYNHYKNVVIWKSLSAANGRVVDYTKPISDARLYMQDDGNLVLYDLGTWEALWVSHTWVGN